MSEKQRKAIEGVEVALGIKYSGEPTAQGAFLFLRDHIEDAQKEVNRIINEERSDYDLCRNASSPILLSNSTLDQMEFYRFDNAEHQLGDENDTYAETPTIDSLHMDAVYWSRLL
ncbi:hypothetical protein [Paenibacillus dendrobii]|nr:hypothetical protein [Paenibacillus dendrobii]